MKVTFLGVGSAFSRKHGNSNVLVESGDIKLLIDCARSGPPNLEKYGLSMKDLTHLFVTHLHSDHAGGFEEIAFMTRLVYKKKLPMISTASLLDRLWKSSLSGGLEYIELSPGNLTPQTLGDFFTPTPVAVQEWVSVEEGSDLRIYLYPTNHVKGMESYGLAIEELPGGEQKRFLFTGDTKFDRDLVMYGIETCALIFHDCQLFNAGKNNELGVHASYEQLLAFPPDIRHRIWLYHYGDSQRPDAESDGFAGFVDKLQAFQF